LKENNSTAYAALRRGAGLVERGHLGRLAIGGADRRAYLQGLLTNDIEALTPGTGCYAAMLTAQGRMIADMRVFELGDAMLIDLPAELAEPVAAHLDRFVFSEDVQVRDASRELAAVGVYGPGAASIVSGLVQPAVAPGSLPLFASTRGTHDGAPVTVLASDEPGVAGFDLVVDAAQAELLAAAVERAGAVRVDLATAEIVRVEAGRPRFGVDMDAETLPLEAGIEDRAISRTKGCYVGQEVIVRVIDRGHGRVARRLVGLTLSSGDGPPARGAAIGSGDREIGRITSAIRSPGLERAIALGYVHRDFTPPGTEVTVSPGTRAVVSELPFVS
jgi:folate-binding protein YgfZ